MTVGTIGKKEPLRFGDFAHEAIDSCALEFAVVPVQLDAIYTCPPKPIQHQTQFFSFPIHTRRIVIPQVPNMRNHYKSIVRMDSLYDRGDIRFFRACIFLEDCS